MLLSVATSVAITATLTLTITLTIALGIAGPPAAAAWADEGSAARQTYRCDGDPLQADLYAGAVDAPAIANASAGTLPGAFVVLQWRGLSLQLPRTNNAGAPSFTDGKWWWSLEDGQHPRFRRRRGSGDIQDIACEPLLQAGG